MTINSIIKNKKTDFSDEEILSLGYGIKYFSTDFSDFTQEEKKFWWELQPKLLSQLEKFLPKPKEIPENKIFLTQLWEPCPKCGKEPIFLETGICKNH